MPDKRLHRRNLIACIWDFDKTLIPGYMQQPLFDRYGIDAAAFWEEVNALPEIYGQRGTRVASDTIYLNHLLTYIKNGPLKGLSNAELRELGAALQFYPGLPDFLHQLKALVRSRPEYLRHEIHLEHYIVSTGLAEMIRGSAIATEVDGIFACEFIEAPLPPYYNSQSELEIEMAGEISQVGMMVDNTIKTRFIFEINKGSNKHPDIDVNAKMGPEDRRIPIPNMIYVADGPSDVPVFSVVRKGGGKCFAVYDPESQGEFEQNDQMLQDGRVNAYGPADYSPTSQTSRWLQLQVMRICDRIVADGERALAERVKRPPRHLHKRTPEVPDEAMLQNELFNEALETVEE